MTPAITPDPTLGRYWGSAARAILTEHREGDATIRFEWSDGAHLVVDYETYAQAREILASLGFASLRLT